MKKMQKEHGRISDLLHPNGTLDRGLDTHKAGVGEEVDEIITPREGGRHGDATLLWAERSKGL
jgi:hypothetical protein